MQKSKGSGNTADGGEKEKWEEEERFLERKPEKLNRVVVAVGLAEKRSRRQCCWWKRRSAGQERERKDS